MRQLTKEGCNKNIMGAAIAQWICLCLPSCCPGFESQTYHLRFYQFILELYNAEKTKIKKEAGIGQFKKL